MNFLENLHWFCLETNHKQTTYRSIFIEKRDNLEIGSELEVAGQSGVVIASSEMGITVFDLFNEIMTVEDMVRFLKQNQVEGEYFGAGLVLRTFIQMLDMTPTMARVDNTTVATVEEVGECSVKIEDTDSYDEYLGFSDQDQRPK